MIHLKSLNLEIPERERFFYLDIGTVEDLDAAVMGVYLMHRVPHGLPRVKNPRVTPLGYTIPITTDTGNGRLCRYIYIAYRSLKDELTDIRIRAHEETHALQHMDSLAYLQNEFNKKQFEVNLYDHDDETQACLGGWYAFIMNKGNILTGTPLRNAHDERAYDIMLLNMPDDIFDAYLR